MTATNLDMDAIYGRVSGKTSEKEESIRTQLFEIDRRFGSEGRQVWAEYLDDPYPGEYLHRPALDRLLEDAKLRRFNRVLCFHPDRLSRGPAWHRPHIEEQLEKYGCAIAYVTYERADTPEGKLLDGIMDDVAVYERRMVKRRFEGGKARRLIEGGPYLRQKMYGWHMVASNEPGQKHPHPEPHPEESKVIREIFDMVLSGMTCYAIAQVLNARGLKLHTGGNWTYCQVARTIHNTWHSGRVPKHKYTYVEATRPKSLYTKQRKLSPRLIPPDQQEYWTLAHHIVTPEEQERAIAMLASNKRQSTRNAKEQYMLSGMVRCACQQVAKPGTVCGRSMCGLHNKSKTRKYICSRTIGNDGKLKVSCKGRINADDVEARVWEAVLGILREPEYFIDALERYTAQHTENATVLEAKITECTATVARCQRMLDVALEKYLAGGIDDRTYHNTQAKLVSDRDNAEAQIAYLQAKLATARDDASRYDAVEAFLHAAARDWHMACSDDPAISAPVKQRYIRELFQTVWVLPDGRIGLEGTLPGMVESEDFTSTSFLPGCIVLPLTSSEQVNTPHIAVDGVMFAMVIAA